MHYIIHKIQKNERKCVQKMIEGFIINFSFTNIHLTDQHSPNRISALLIGEQGNNKILSQN